MQPVLIAHNEPDDFRDMFAARFPDVDFTYAATAQGVAEALARHDPEVVFSIKHPDFRAPYMRRFPRTPRCAGFMWAARGSIMSSPGMPGGSP